MTGPCAREAIVVHPGITKAGSSRDIAPQQPRLSGFLRSHRIAAWPEQNQGNFRPAPTRELNTAAGPGGRRLRAPHKSLKQQLARNWDHIAVAGRPAARCFGVAESIGGPSGRAAGDRGCDHLLGRAIAGAMRAAVAGLLQQRV
jgi:hypothetical protein